MKQLKRIALCTLIVGMLLLSACTTNASIVYNIENGESIKVTLNTTDGYKLTDGGSTFVVSSKTGDLSTGLFLLPEDYQNYMTNVPTAEGATVLDQGTKDGKDYLFYQYENGTSTEYDYIIKVEGVDAGVALGNLVSAESAEAAFDNLSFEKG